MSSGRSFAIAALVAGLGIACGSSDSADDPGDPTGGDGGATDGASSSVPGVDGGPVGVSTDGGAADARTEAAAPDAATGPSYSGEATYYAADGTGACGYPASANLDVAAMNKAQYAKSVCGKCVRVKGPKGEVTVRIVDLCPGCKMGDLDLSEQAFAQIANMSAGRVKISWSFVACP